MFVISLSVWHISSISVLSFRPLESAHYRVPSFCQEQNLLNSAPQHTNSYVPIVSVPGFWRWFTVLAAQLRLHRIIRQDLLYATLGQWLTEEVALEVSDVWNACDDSSLERQDTRIRCYPRLGLQHMSPWTPSNLRVQKSHRIFPKQLRTTSPQSVLSACTCPQWTPNHT